MKAATNRTARRWSPTLLTGMVAVLLAGAGCVAGELSDGSWEDGEEEEGAEFSPAAYFDDTPAPFEISEEEYAALMAEEEQEAPAPDPAEAAPVEEEVVPAEGPSGDVMIEESGEREIALSLTSILTNLKNLVANIVAYVQINKSSRRGSCGSHSGAVAIGKLLGKKTVAEVRAIETAIYRTLPARPAAARLVTAYNRYLAARRSPWRAKLFGSSSNILGYLKIGSPVVANTTQWGGHYVTILGLSGGKITFSDGTFTDGVAAKLPTGFVKRWAYSTFLRYAKGLYIGFSR